LNILSLFDGCSCGRVALERSGIEIDNYFASEIDKYAIGITNKNYPNTIQLGDINNWKEWNLPKIDLIMGGSPCQGFSRAGQGLNFDDPRGKLFFVFIDILKFYNPEYFLLENVKLKEEWRDIITGEIGVKPILINSSLVSAQNRERYYWTNITVNQPEDKGILLKSVVMSDVYPVVLHNIYGGFNESSVRVFENKSPTLRTSGGGGHIPSFVKRNLSFPDNKVANFFKETPYNVFKDWDCIRKFHPIECERLQTLPDNYTEGVSNTQRYKMLGNGFTADIISHILNFIPKE